MTNIVETDTVAPYNTHTLSDIVKELAYILDDYGYFVAWHEDATKGPIRIEGEAFDITMRDDDLIVTHSDGVKEKTFVSTNPTSDARQIFKAIMTYDSFNEQALRIVNSAAARLGLNIEIERPDGIYFNLKHMDDYMFHPEALKQFVKAVKRHESDIEATAATDVAIKVLQWYTKETACHEYGVILGSRGVYTLSIGKDSVSILTAASGKMRLKSRKLKLEFNIESADADSIEKVMSTYADKIRVKAFTEALLP